MAGERRSWQEIARDLGKEKEPERRRRLEQELRQALEQAGFKSFGEPEKARDRENNGKRRR